MASENKAWTEVPQLQPRKGNDAPQCGPLNQGQEGPGLGHGNGGERSL